MKKLKTNIRYFMQLRQSPSMMLHLQNSKAPQPSRWGTPPRKTPAPLSPTAGSGASGQPALVVEGGPGKLVTTSSPKEGTLPRGAGGRSETLGTSMPRLTPVYHSFAVWPWSSSFTSLDLALSNWKVEIKNRSFLPSTVVRMS